MIYVRCLSRKIKAHTRVQYVALNSSDPKPQENLEIYFSSRYRSIEILQMRKFEFFFDRISSCRLVVCSFLFYLLSPSLYFFSIIMNRSYVEEYRIRTSSVFVRPVFLIFLRWMTFFFVVLYFSEWLNGKRNNKCLLRF